MDAFERLMALHLGDILEVERIRRWTIYKWCLLLSVLTVSMNQTSLKTLANKSYDLAMFLGMQWLVWFAPY